MRRRTTAASMPGPTLVLRRGEPVEITLVNRLPEATAIHWHGMELDSYYDGVHGWSGVGSRVTPLIEPGATFVVRFTPPRTGTFIYHTHLHDHRQLPSACTARCSWSIRQYRTRRSILPTDHVFVIGGAAAAELDAAGDAQWRRAIRGSSWKAGHAASRAADQHHDRRHLHGVAARRRDGPVTWRPLTKDGAPLATRSLRPADPRGRLIAVGETYDFEVQTPPGRQNLWLEVQDAQEGSGRFRGRLLFEGSGFRVQGSGFRVQSSGSESQPVGALPFAGLEVSQQTGCRVRGSYLQVEEARRFFLGEVRSWFARPRCDCVFRAVIRGRFARSERTLAA